MSVEALRRRKPVKLICVTPSHQFPSGALMPLGRRLELLSLASDVNAVVLGRRL